ncbi:MAG: ankyrin repeat domain-containing protein [Wolbachia sp.]
MAIEKKTLFEIIQKVSKSKDLSEDNLLEKIRDELYEVEKKLPEEDCGEYNKFKNGLWKDHLFSVKTSNGPVDYTLLHLAVACDNLSIVELLLKKKVNVNTRVKDGSKDDGPTALHIAAFYGHKDMVEQLLKDDRVNPLLESKNKTPKDMVGDVSNKNTIVEILETAEKNYLLKKAKDLNIKIEGGGRYHLSQSNHKTQVSLAVNGDNVTSAPANVIDPHLERYDSMHSDDSGLELEQTTPNTSFHFLMNPNRVNHVEENVDNKTLESTLRSQIQLKDSRIQELEKSDKELKEVSKNWKKRKRI